VPARDLTEEEAEAIGYERVRALVSPHTGEEMYREIEWVDEVDVGDEVTTADVRNTIGEV
jgi:hypothetical protein